MSTEIGRREARRQTGDGRHDPVHLLGLGDFGARAGFDPADVEDVRPLGHERFGSGVERVEGERRALVVERVGGPVQDPHDQAPVGEIVPLPARGRGRSPGA